MKALSLIIATILMSTSVMATERTLLECHEKYNSLTITFDDKDNQVSFSRNPWSRGLMYANRDDETEENPVIVRGNESLEYNAYLMGTKVELKGSILEITFGDKKATKVFVSLKKVKEGQQVDIKAEDPELQRSILAALSVGDERDELTFYGSCVFK